MLQKGERLIEKKKAEVGNWREAASQPASHADKRMYSYDVFNILKVAGTNFLGFDPMTSAGFRTTAVTFIPEENFGLSFTFGCM